MRGLKHLLASGSSRHDRAWAELTSAAADGELSGAEAQRFRLHSAGCARCQARADLYRRQTLYLRNTLNRSAAPSAHSILATIKPRDRWYSALTARHLAAAASVVAILFAVIASPSIRDRAAGLERGLRAAMSPQSPSSRAGQAGAETASTSKLAAPEPALVLFHADAAGGQAAAVRRTLVGRGPLYVLADGRVLSRGAGDGSAHGWVTIGPDGSSQPFAAATDANVVDVTPDGRRILLRHRTPLGDYSTDAGATLVVDAGGTIVWQDPGGADVYSLSPDGRYALSGDSTGMREIPLDGGESTFIPLDRHPVHRPQLSRDGTRAVFLAERIGIGEPEMALAYARVGDGNYQVLSGGPVSANPPPAFRLSPDGRYLAAETGSTGQQALTIYDLDGGDVDEVAALRGAAIRDLSWSPDGRRLLILASRGARDEAWIRAQDGELSRLGAGRVVTSAAWLPHSSGIVFAGP